MTMAEKHGWLYNNLRCIFCLFHNGCMQRMSSEITYVKLRSDKQRRRTDQLQAATCDVDVLEVEVEKLHGEVQSLVVQFEALLNLYQVAIWLQKLGHGNFANLITV